MNENKLSLYKERISKQLNHFLDWKSPSQAIKEIKERHVGNFTNTVLLSCPYIFLYLGSIIRHKTISGLPFLIASFGLLYWCYDSIKRNNYIDVLVLYVLVLISNFKIDFEGINALVMLVCYYHTFLYGYSLIMKVYKIEKYIVYDLAVYLLKMVIVVILFIKNYNFYLIYINNILTYVIFILITLMFSIKVSYNFYRYKIHPKRILENSSKFTYKEGSDYSLQESFVKSGKNYYPLKIENTEITQIYLAYRHWLPAKNSLKYKRVPAEYIPKKQFARGEDGRVNANIYVKKYFLGFSIYTKNDKNNTWFIKYEEGSEIYYMIYDFVCKKDFIFLKSYMKIPKFVSAINTSISSYINKNQREIKDYQKLKFDLAENRSFDLFKTTKQVIKINADFGTGKSYFIDQCARFSRKHNIIISPRNSVTIKNLPAHIYLRVLGRAPKLRLSLFNRFIIPIIGIDIGIIVAIYAIMDNIFIKQKGKYIFFDNISADIYIVNMTITIVLLLASIIYQRYIIVMPKMSDANVYNFFVKSIAEELKKSNKILVFEDIDREDIKVFNSILLLIDSIKYYLDRVEGVKIVLPMSDSHVVGEATDLIRYKQNILRIIDLEHTLNSDTEDYLKYLSELEYNETHPVLIENLIKKLKVNMVHLNYREVELLKKGIISREHAKYRFFSIFYPHQFLADSYFYQRALSNEIDTLEKLKKIKKEKILLKIPGSGVTEFKSIVNKSDEDSIISDGTKLQSCTEHIRSFIETRIEFVGFKDNYNLYEYKYRDLEKEPLEDPPDIRRKKR